jgi:hypothetical protein
MQILNEDFLIAELDPPFVVEGSRGYKGLHSLGRSKKPSKALAFEFNDVAYRYL